ncbi:MAG: hypothetical protein ACTSPB_04080 [Candidatus Thorarchaeota archaeon]
MVYKIEGATIKATTGKAILVEADCFDEDEWIPLSQVDDESEIWSKGEEGTLTVSDWIANKKGLNND